jgi:hypothetical protein
MTVKHWTIFYGARAPGCNIQLRVERDACVSEVEIEREALGSGGNWALEGQLACVHQGVQPQPAARPVA